jgi:bisphosphoglycerate-independent phosphoglycerate mutase (AlkP superfamily)
MKRLISIGSVLAFALCLAAPAVAGDAAAPTTVQGWITDSFCGANNANAAGAKCAKDCYKNGAKLELVADGKTYQLSDQKLAFENIGHEVVITGTIDKDMIKVEKIEAAKKDKA